MGVGVPRDPKVNFWVSVWLVPRPGNFLRIGHVQSRSMLPQLSTQQVLQMFFSLLCTDNRTHFYYSSTISASMLPRHTHQPNPHVKGFMHEHLCLLNTYSAGLFLLNPRLDFPLVHSMRPIPYEVRRESALKTSESAT